MPGTTKQSERPTGRDAARTRDLVLQGAMEEFIAKGFAGARIDAVAERAGVNVRSIYQHFDSKATLFRAVLGDSVKHRHEKLVMTMRSLLEEPGRAAELLPAFRATLADNLGWVRLIAWNELSEDLESRTAEFFAADSRRALYTREIESIDAARARGTLPASLDSDLLLLAMTALATFPSIVRPLSMLVTGQDPASDEFRARYDAFLNTLGRIIAEGGHPPVDPPDPTFRSAAQSSTVAPQLHRQLRIAGRALARHGLVGPFGSCSVRLDRHSFLLTASVPLVALTDQPGTVVPISGPVPEGAGADARLHQSVYRARADVGAVGRLDLVDGRARDGGPLRPRDRPSAFFGPGPREWSDPSCADTEAVASTLASATAITLRGQGSLVAAASIQQAVALAMFLQQAGSARLQAGPDRLLTSAEIAELGTWDEGAAEQVWTYLTVHDPERGGQ